VSVDLLSSSQERKWSAAGRVKNLVRVRLPLLPDWNYGPCQHHTEPDPACAYRLCGGPLFDHQTVSATFHYIAENSIDASQTGTGKTGSLLATLCLAKHRGEALRAVLVVPTNTVAQWTAETNRFAPGLHTVSVTSGLSKQQRLVLYAGHWECLIIGFHLMTRDISALEQLRPAQVISDDVDPILQVKNATHKAMIRLTRSADRVIIANATSLQTRLEQLYAASLPLGGRDLWGSLTSFRERYIKREPVYIWTTDSRGRRESRKVFKSVGYKNLTHFREKFNPMVIRHRYDDLVDLRIPEIVVEHIYVDLHPAQRTKYTVLQQGVLELMKKDQPPQQKRVSALAAWTHGAQICAGLPALGEEDGPQASSKLDWVLEHVTGEWVDQKIVVYARNRGTISALQARLTEAGVGYSTIWGAEADSQHRAEEVRRFWENPETRVMILSAAGERSLNLQNASVLVSIDLNLNPARVQQLMGRIRRAGSTHTRVFAVNLLASDSQEERYLLSLASRQALADFVNDEDSGDLFERLSTEDLLKIISP